MMQHRDPLTPPAELWDIPELSEASPHVLTAFLQGFSPHSSPAALWQHRFSFPSGFTEM